MVKTNGFLTGKKDSCSTNECELERYRIILDDDLKELPLTSEAKEILQRSRNERNYNELELFLIELTGSRKNVFSFNLEFRMMDNILYQGTIKRLGSNWILIESKEDGRRLLQISNVTTIE